VAAADLLFQDAIEVAQLQGSRSLQLRATVSLGRLWRAESRHEEALALLTPVHASFTEGPPDLKDAVEARAAWEMNVR
jgi:hypothetical protein